MALKCFPKSGNRFLDKKRDRTQKLERSTSSSGGRTALCINKRLFGLIVLGMMGCFAFALQAQDIIQDSSQETFQEISQENFPNSLFAPSLEETGQPPELSQTSPLPQPLPQTVPNSAPREIAPLTEDIAPSEVAPTVEMPELVSPPPVLSEQAVIPPAAPSPEDVGETVTPEGPFPAEDVGDLLSIFTPALAVNANLPHDLSPYNMFMQADIIVQGVMVGLLAASILTWVIWLAKFIEITMAKHRVRCAVKALIASRSLAEAIEKTQDKKGISVRLIMAAAAEVRLSLGAVDGAGSEGMKERIASHLARIEVRSGRVISRGTGILASIGSVAPFVGLFGTVWGIMNSFIGISQSQTTNLAVVAPGIAEALLATAMGLFAAIPAVVIYNFFARSITVYRQMLADVSAAIERLVSRDLDFRLAHKKAGQPLLETVGE